MANNIVLHDAAQANVTVRTYQDANGVHTPYHIAHIGVNNAAVSANNPVAVFPGSNAVFSVSLITGNTHLGVVSLDNFPNNQIVTLSNNNVLVGNFPATQNVVITSAITISNFPATQPISATSLPLPSGAATTIDITNLANTIGTPLQANGNVNVVSNVLAPGAASNAGLTTLHNDLINVITNLSSGNKTDANGYQFVTISNFPSANQTFTLANNTVTISNFPANQNVTVTSLPKGSANTANSLAVTIATDQAPVPVNTVISTVATNRGGLINAASVSQQFMPANTSRRGWSIQNQSNTAMWVSGLANATPDFNSLLIPAGEYYETSSQHAGTGAMSIYCTLANAAFYAREY